MCCNVSLRKVESGEREKKIIRNKNEKKTMRTE